MVHTSSDAAYEKYAKDASSRETKLLELKRKLGTWVSLLPSCLSSMTSQEADSPDFNGQFSFQVKDILAYRW